MKTSKLIWRALLHAVLAMAYIALVVFVISNGERVFGSMKNFFGPMVFLTLFVVSASITGFLIIGKPVMLYIDNQKKDAVKFFSLTLGWVIVLMMVLFGILKLTQ